jgi:hypothetical protein
MPASQRKRCQLIVGVQTTNIVGEKATVVVSRADQGNGMT